MTNEQGQSFTVQIAADEQGIVDNGDGTINVILNEDIDANTGLPRISQMSKEQIENMAEATNMARLQQYEQQKLVVDARQYKEDSTGRTPENPFRINDRITLSDAETGNVENGVVGSELTDDGKYEVVVEKQDGSQSIHYLSPSELEQLGAKLEQPEAVEEGNAPVPAQNQPVLEQKTEKAEQESAMSRIPLDRDGVPQFEQAQTSDTWEALLELNGGNAVEAEDTARQMYENASKNLDKAQKTKPKSGTSVMEIQRNKAERNGKIDELRKSVDFWGKVLSFPEAERKSASAAAAAEVRQKEDAKREAVRQAKENLAKGRKLMQQKGTYYKDDAKLGDYLDFHDYALRMIANGRVKFVWKNDADNNSIRGLSGHLGLADSESERKALFSLLANPDKGGLRPDDAAEQLSEEYNSSLGAEVISSSEALDVILDIIRTYGGKTRDMMNAAIDAHANVNTDRRGFDSFDEHDASELVTSMSANAEPIPNEELTPENWNKEFGDRGEVETPVGVVKMGENQLAKLFMKGRANEFGMIKPTLNNPDVIVEEYSTTKNDDAERESSYLFVKTFDRDGEKIKFFTSVTVRKEGLEVVISNHFVEKKALVKKITEGNVIYIKEALSSNSSEKHLAENQNDLPDLLPTQENNASSEEDNMSSGSKDTNISEESNTGSGKSVAEQITEQREVVNTEPTEAQKEAGNYRMGHVKIDGMDVTIENPKGSIRKGIDADGKEWQSEMHNDYGYIRGTKAVDNDHIDVFLSDDPEHGNVYVIDQVDPKTGKFDESKVMYGFSSEQEARDAYLSNYEEGWKGLGKITEVTKEEFKKWIDSSTRKTKPFSEYASVKPLGGNAQNKIIVEVFREWNGKLRKKYRSSPKFRDLDNAISVAKYQVDEGNVKPDAQKNFEKAVQLIPELYFGSGDIQFSIGKQNHKATTSSGVKDFAEKYSVSQEAVEDYANGMRLGTGSGCGYALQSIRRDFRLANSTLKFAEFSHEYAKLKQELFDKFGDYDKLKAQQLAEADAKRDAMEAARKRIEEEQQRKKAEYEARIARYKGLSLDELDSEYFKALENKDEVSARDIVDEVARRNGYTDVASDYQGVGAWAAPTRPGGYTDEERRASLETDSPDLSLEDISLGYTLQPDDIFDHPERYMQSDSTSKEAARAIKATLNALKKGNKEAKIKVFRAVPLSVKEGRLRNGDWVTPSRAYADMHGNHRLEGEYRVIEEEVPAKDLWWDGNDVREWGYDDGTARRYANVENNTKLNDVITKDDAGNIIPPSRRFDSGNVDERYHISGRKAIDERSEESRIAYEAVKEQFDRIGIPVELLSDQAMREMAINATMLDTALPEDESSFKGTVISSTDGANILNNLDKAIDDYQNIGDKGTKTFLGDLASALGSSDKDKSSQYATFETKNGQVVTIRVSNHNATISNFDNVGESNGISIVISRKPNEGMTNDGDAHIVEFFYPDKALNKADGKPLVEILKSIKQSLYSGEYKDTTGLAQREEVNAKDVPEFMTVYHGSGAKFDRFDHSHMGEGEGAQAYGWGTYVTEVEGIGRAYAKAMAAKYDGKLSKRNLYTVDIPEDIEKFPMSKDEMMEAWKALGNESFFLKFGLDESQAKDAFNALVPAQLAGLSRGDYYWGRYNRNFKKYGIRRWDMNMAVMDKVKEMRLANPKKYGFYLNWIGRIDKWIEKLGISEDEYERYDMVDGEDAYHYLEIKLGGAKQASDYLSEHGYVGIKYPAQYMSGGRSDGARNYVIFNENDAKITGRIEFLREPDGTVYGATVGGKIYLNQEHLNPNTPIHEYTHLWFSALKDANPELYKRGVELMKQLPIWEEVKTDPNYANLSGDDAIASECLSRLVGDKGADKLTELSKKAMVRGDIIGTANRISLIEDFKDWLKKFWTWVKDSFAPWTKEEASRVSVDDIQNMVLSDLAKGVNPLARQAESDPYIRFSIVKDPKLIEELDKGAKVKVYRAMQLIDGKLYPPMASKINGEFVRPIELGKWEQADEHPELIDKNGRFNLNKGNGKGLKAAYNPYIHTSRTPLNDQFSEAQSRPNIVTVEVEIPKSELSSGYKADKAKDSVGEMEWKAGIVQGQLTGKRKVILSRWDKPIRIVPDSEVANVIVNDMFKGRTITMPSNVVTPSLRAELEKLGVPFVQTDNTGHIVGGQYDGKHYSKVYGNGALAGNAKGKRMESETDRIVREAKDNGTYMKAPNGNPTNLNERQWAQVRTRAFKKWFGDWEKAARIEKLRRSEPVIISGQEHEGKYELNRESAKAWMKDNLRGSYENEDTKTVITIGRKGVNKVTSHSMGSEAHLKSIAAIPEMLKKAIFITREQATKAGAQYPEYEYYVVGIKIGDVDYTAKVTIGVDENGNKFYDHALTEIEKGKLLDQKNGQAASPGFISTEINPSVTKGKDTKLFSILQTNSSKIVDENGEPKVVYHGSPYRFFRFDKTKLGQSTGADSAKEGFFFTDNKELAELFSRYSLENLPVSDVERLVKDRLLNMSEDELNDAYEVYRNDSPDYLDYADETDSPNDRDYLEISGFLLDGVSEEDAKRKYIQDSIESKIEGGYFSDMEEIEEELSSIGIEFGNNEQVFLNIESPVVDEVERDYFHNGEDVSPMTPVLQNAKRTGRDGVVFTGIVESGQKGAANQYVAFEPNQIKSATDNVGTFDGEQDDIRYRDSDRMDAEYMSAIEAGDMHKAGRMVEAAAAKLAEILGEKVRIVRNVNEIENRNEKVQENQRRSKGWFNTGTGEIVVVLPNATGIEDVQATILHEAVGHKGLRELIGDDEFDDFLDKVYAAASVNTRREIVNLARRSHWDFRLATEEYIAGLAENGFAGRENRTLFEKIKDFFRDMLSRAKIALGVNIGDNELRYMLWRTYQMRTSRGVLAKAEDISMQQAMKVGNFRNEVPEEASGLRFRNSSNGSRKNLARDIYEEKTRIVDKKGQKTDTANLMRRLKEAYVDSMQSLKYLQDAVAEETGKPVEDFENAYLAENAMSSKNKAQTDIYLNKFFNPIKDAIRELQKKGVEYNDIVRYLMAKHGLERNVVFSKRDAQRAGAVWDGIVRRDYSGLTELTRQENDTSTPSIQEITSRANEIVHNFEKEYYVDELWSTINNATKETLRTSYVDGLLTKDNYEMVRSMFDYYIPLRGWNENVASVEYDYLSDSRPKTSKIVKAATGRTTISDDPIATIAYMGQSAIIQGNRNMMKQKLLNLALNHKTGLITVNRQWEVQDPVTGEWLTRNPVIPVDATPEEIADIVSQFEADMKAAEKNGTARISRGKLDTGKHITAYEGQEHVVKVKRGGIEYCIYLNGNPRAAQAVNGMTNPDAVDSWLIRKARIIKNFMARMSTSQNPAFIISNLICDVIFAGTAVFAKEDSKYTALYTKNIAKALAKGQLIGLVHRFETGRLDDSKDIDRYFGEFIRNGGETGFTQLNTVDDFKRDLNRFAKEMKQGQVMKVSSKVWNGIWDGVEFMNRCAEDVTRFSVYMTSRQMGRSVERSISDAKEITVNFNRKGSGGFGARVMNFAYIFFNAAVQSLANAGKMIYEHPAKVTAILGTFSASGFLAPLLAQAIISLCGGDDDAYWDLPEWVRRNNFVFYIPWSDNKFLIIPISQELRPFYAMGEIAMSVLMGKEEVLDGLKSAAGSFMDLLPVDFMGNGGNLAVSLTPTVAQPFAQLVANSDYFGKPIYRRNDYNRLDPAWTKAYKGTSSMLINASKWLNEVTGGDDVKRGWIDPVNNPAVIEHLFESYLGGVGKTINKTAKTISMIWNPEMRDIRNVPIVSTFVQESDDERVAGSQLNREYVKAMEEFRETEHTISGYKRKARMGSMEYADKLSDFMNTPEFKKYSKMKGYASSIAKLRTALKKTEELNGDVMDAEYLQEMLRELKQQMLEELKED